MEWKAVLNDNEIAFKGTAEQSGSLMSLA